MDKNSLRASKALQSEIRKEQPMLNKIKNYLIEGADINYQSEDGYTSLMFAVESMLNS